MRFHIKKMPFGGQNGSKGVLASQNAVPVLEGRQNKVLSPGMTRQPLALAVTVAATELRCRGPPPAAAAAMYSPTRSNL